MQPTIETNRLHLCNFQASDLPLLAEICADAKVMEFVFEGKMDPERFRQFIQQDFAQNGEVIGLQSLFLKQDRQLIGFAGLHQFTYNGKPEIEFGFAIDHHHWRKGYGYEIGKAQIEFAFQILKVQQLFALAHPENKASSSLLEKLGMNYLQNIEAQRGTRLLYQIQPSQ